MQPFTASVSKSDTASETSRQPGEQPYTFTRPPRYSRGLNILASFPLSILRHMIEGDWAFVEKRLGEVVAS